MRVNKLLLLAAVTAVMVPVAGLTGTGAAGAAVRSPALEVRRLAPVRPGDEVVTGRGDQNGWHLFAASSGGGWRWQPLATIQPAGDGSEGWIGQQCLTGDGRFVVAVIAAWHAQNEAWEMDRGALAYVVNAHTGVVRPLAAGVSLAYFDPGCGTGSRVALTRFPGRDERVTQVMVADAATGKVTMAEKLRGQITSAVPVGRGAEAAVGGSVVRIGPGSLVPVAHARGQVFALRPNDAGGVDFLSAIPGGSAAIIWRQTRSGTLRAGYGPLERVGLFSGRGGRTVVTGAARIDRRAGLRAVTAASPVPVAGASLAGGALLLAGITPTAGRAHQAARRAALRAAASGTSAVLIRAGTGQRLAAALPAATAPVTTVVPANGVPGPASATARPASTTASRAGAAPATGSASGCAVPRTDPGIQVPQPTSDEVRWAVSQAVTGSLRGAEGRPAGFDDLGLPAYDPSADFPLPALAGDPSAPVPREVLEGIFAQESNFSQASWHAIPGVAGDPLVADYYGYNATGGIDLSQADCGYGLGQLTDIMTAAATASVGYPDQEKVAVDFAENTAAAAQAIARKWNQLEGLGISAGGDPTTLEDWYFAIWAYNSGVEPNAAHGNTTGCSPSSACTDAWGNWGLGWANNPINPDYNPQRNPFLHTFDTTGAPVLSYGDASHPQDWPYQEKVFGWMETAQFDPVGNQKYAGTFNWNSMTGSFLNRPPPQNLCDTSDNCNAADTTGQYCLLNPLAGTPAGEQYHCWLHHGDDFCATAARPCQPSTPEADVAAYDPGSTSPFPVVCDPDTTQVPNGAIIVSTQNGYANQEGCPNPATSWTNQGTFSTQFGNLAPVDWHQLGVGFGGHNWFTHTVAADSAGAADWQVTGTWTPSGLTAQPYEIKAFVPDDDAAGLANYQVNSGYGQSWQTQIDQNLYGNQWVSLGTYWLGGNATVTLTNLDTNPADDPRAGDDVAYDALAFVPAPAGKYAILGDSYSSGEGTGNYDLSANDCHRSSQSFGEQYAVGPPVIYPRANITDAACSGATIANLTTNGQNGEAAQISQIPSDANLVTVTIGGNDAGFANVLTQCVTPSANACQESFTQDDANNENGIIEKLEPSLAATYRAIRSQAPHALVVAVTYPNIFKPGSVGGAACPNIGAISQPDIEWLIDETYHVDDVIDQAAIEAGIPVLDERYAFVGHELCSGASWVNGLLSSPITDFSMNFHPTATGYTQIAKDLGAFLATSGNGAAGIAAVNRPAIGQVPQAATATWAGWRNTLLIRRLPTTTKAIDMFHELVRQPASNTSYDNSYFGSGWSRARPALPGCNIRTYVLTRDAEPGSITYVPGPTGPTCTIASATWQSPYDDPVGPTLGTVTGDPMAMGTPGSPVDVDHVVSKKDAWVSGADDWIGVGNDLNAQRFQFANDTDGLELLSVSEHANEQKGDSTPDQWLPSDSGNPAFNCDFLKMYVQVKWQWNLSITDDEYLAIANNLTIAACGA